MVGTCARVRVSRRKQGAVAWLALVSRTAPEAPHGSPAAVPEPWAQEWGLTPGARGARTQWVWLLPAASLVCPQTLAMGRKAVV